MFEKRESETIRRVCDKKYTLSTSDEKTGKMADDTRC